MASSAAVRALSKAFGGDTVRRKVSLRLLVGGLGAKQRKVVKRVFDEKRTRTVVWGGRRSGKSRVFAVICIILDSLLGQNNETIAFCAPTITMGKGILFPQIEILNKEFGLGAKLRHGHNQVLLPNGTTIQLFGLGSSPDVDRLRGKRFVLGIVDELGHTNPALAKVAIVEALGPACLDMLGIGGRGILLGGTPSRLTKSWWHEQCENDNDEPADDSVHMTMHDNPFFEGRVEAAIAAYCADNKIDPDSSAAMREVWGKFCIDSDGLCYAWNGFVLPENVVPMGGQTLLAIDFGKNYSAFVVGRVSNGVLYILESRQTEQNTLQGIVDTIRELRTTWGIGEMIGDSEDGIAVLSLAQQYHFPIVGAKKHGSKLDRIWLLDGDLKNNATILCEKTATLQEQLRTVLWNEKLTDHNKKQKDHCIDATHYLRELAASFIVRSKPKPGPQPGTAEWLKQQEEKAIRDVMSRAGLTPDGRRRR